MLVNIKLIIHNNCTGAFSVQIVSVNKTHVVMYTMFMQETGMLARIVVECCVLDIVLSKS